MQINDLAMELLDSKGLLCGTWENGKGTLMGSPSADPLHPWAGTETRLFDAILTKPISQNVSPTSDQQRHSHRC